MAQLNEQHDQARAVLRLALWQNLVAAERGHAAPHGPTDLAALVRRIGEARPAAG